MVQNEAGAAENEPRAVQLAAVTWKEFGKRLTLSDMLAKSDACSPRRWRATSSQVVVGSSCTELRSAMVFPLNLTVIITGSVVSAGSTGGTVEGVDGGAPVEGVDGAVPCGVERGAESAGLRRYAFRSARKEGAAASPTSTCSAPNDDSNVSYEHGHLIASVALECGHDAIDIAALHEADVSAHQRRLDSVAHTHRRPTRRADAAVTFVTRDSLIGKKQPVGGQYTHTQAILLTPMLPLHAAGPQHPQSLSETVIY